MRTSIRFIWAISRSCAVIIVGALRVMKNRHWLADVLFSAGVGIGSTELVYQLYPWLRRVVFHKKNMALVPIYTGSSTGVCMMAVF